MSDQEPDEVDGPGPDFVMPETGQNDGLADESLPADAPSWDVYDAASPDEGHEDDVLSADHPPHESIFDDPKPKGQTPNDSGPKQTKISGRRPSSRLQARSAPRAKRAAPGSKPAPKKKSGFVPVMLILIVLIAGKAAIDHAVEARKPSTFPSIGTSPSETWEPLPTREPTVPAPPSISAEPRWSLAEGDLRESGNAEIESVDGFADSQRFVDGGDVWLFATVQRSDAEPDQLAAVSLETGERLWTRKMPQVYCAEELVGDKAACASAIKRDLGSSLGTRWRVELLDPRTGEVSKSAEVDAWISTMFVAGNHIGFLEQRLPAPHVAVTMLDAELNVTSVTDFKDSTRLYFSENRSIQRYPIMPDGPALMNPRLLHFSHDLTVLWLVGSTIYINDVTGEVVTLLDCERPYDDGERIWCNSGGSAIAHDYALNPLYRSDLSIKLHHPRRDLNQPPIFAPIFMDEDGQLMHVDLATGATIGPLLATAHGEVFGMQTSTMTTSVSGIALTKIAGYLVAFDPRTGELLWDLRADTDSVVDYGDSLIVESGLDYLVVDKASGHVWQKFPGPSAYPQLMVRGDRLYAVGFDGIFALN